MSTKFCECSGVAIRKMSLQRDAGHDEERRGVERGQRHAFARAGGVVRLVAEGVHGLDGLGLPVRDDVALVLVEAEVRADVDVEVVLVALVAEQGIGLGQRRRCR